jgi:tyrosinase
MVALTRRSFVAGAATIPFALWFERYAFAQPPLVRFNALSPQGQAMLKVYAKAVNKMQTATAEGDPKSWVFQWYTHSVKGSTTKAAELTRIFPAPSPQRNLAQDMWSTCQAHGGGNEDFFLPWHRMFVYFFESIVRKVSGVPTFTLPYWNYSAAGAVHGVTPAEFRQPNDPNLKPLFVAKRNPNANSGMNIAKGQPGDPLNLSSLAQCVYSASGNIPGFNMALDSGLHGTVHVLVGNGQNMGAVPWAAGDPIFWMHHSNIDRLWASWNAAGRKNPVNAAWLAKTFVFADAQGQKVVAKIQDFVDIAKLKYSYDRLEPVPACRVAGSIILSSVDSVKRRAAVSAPVALGAAPVRATLEPAAPPAGAAGGAAASLSTQIAALPANRHLYLVLKGLRAEALPEVLYHVYLEVPSDTAPEKREDLYVGAINFFDAVHGDHPAGAPAAPGGSRFFSFDVTDLAKTLRAKGALSAKPTVTIVPVGQPAAEAKAVVGEITLVEQ